MSSVPEEGNLLIRQLEKKSVMAGKPLYRGRVRGKEVVYIISGMGKTNAAHASTLVLEKFSPDVLILFGVGGAYPSSGLRVGDIAVAEKELYGDEGVMTAEGFQGTEFIGIPLAAEGGRKYFNEFPLDKELVGRALGSLAFATRPSAGSIAAGSGRFVTVSTCTGTRKRALELQKRFGGICENMEGAAAAHLCALYRIRMAEIRGISNIVGVRDRAKWDIRLAAENCQEAVMTVLKGL
ncbi:MAG: futalosine hydrolase [Nitrospirae bacterium]|nr:futalosine hydrolase [Nitrospirota bacterium]